MQDNKRLTKHKHHQREWEINDFPLMLDEYRVVFGEASYLLEYLQMGVFNDVFNGRKPGSVGMAVDDADFAQRFPVLNQLMCNTADDEGKARQVCTLTIVCEDGQVKCGINERNHGLSLWRSAGTIGGVFAELEEALGERPVEWRKVAWKGRGARP